MCGAILRPFNVSWSVGCVGFNGFLRQHFSIYRGGRRKIDKTDDRKMSK